MRKALLHGGRVPWYIDGGPETWWSNELDIYGNPKTGARFCSNGFDYPNAVQAATLWFHDHSLVRRCRLTLSNPR